MEAEWFVLWTILLYPGRLIVIVQSGWICFRRKGLFKKFCSPENKKDRLAVIPNQSILSYSVDIMRLFARNCRNSCYFALFLAVSIKNNHPCFVSKHEWLGGASRRTRTYNPSVNSRMLCHWAIEASGNGVQPVSYWNPAATYPPGPCPAKYFRRWRA